MPKLEMGTFPYEDIKGNRNYYYESDDGRFKASVLRKDGYWWSRVYIDGKFDEGKSDETGETGGEADGAWYDALSAAFTSSQWWLKHGSKKNPKTKAEYNRFRKDQIKRGATSVITFYQWQNLSVVDARRNPKETYTKGSIEKLRKKYTKQRDFVLNGFYDRRGKEWAKLDKLANELNKAQGKAVRRKAGAKHKSVLRSKSNPKQGGRTMAKRKFTAKQRAAAMKNLKKAWAKNRKGKKRTATKRKTTKRRVVKRKTAVKSKARLSPKGKRKGTIYKRGGRYYKVGAARKELKSSAAAALRAKKPAKKRTTKKRRVVRRRK